MVLSLFLHLKIVRELLSVLIPVKKYCKNTTYFRFSYPYNNMIVNPPSTLSPISSHFASMIDLNGDCFSDIIFVSGPQNNKF